MMSKRTLLGGLAIVVSCILIYYGWIFFQELNHNRLVFENNIYNHIPIKSKTVVTFNREHYFDDYFKVDTTNASIINALKNDITYPLLVSVFETNNDLLLMKVTRDQETKTKYLISKLIAPHHYPKVKYYKQTPLLFYTLANDDFIITTYINGILAISRDYQVIEDFINQESFDFFLENNTQANYYIKRTRVNAPVSIITYQDSTTYVLSYTLRKDTIMLEGEYFGKLRENETKLSYNEINSLLKLEGHYTDSVDWQNPNRIKIWINKIE